jgi:hypothetical protein
MGNLGDHPNWWTRLLIRVFGREALERWVAVGAKDDDQP